MYGPAEIGLMFRQERENRGLTQGQMGVAIGLDQSTISTIEIGKVKEPFPSTMVKMAEAIGISVEEVAKHYGVKLHHSPASSSQPNPKALPASQTPGHVQISYATVREVLNLIEAARGGPQDAPGKLNRLMFQISRHLPDTELPEYLGGQFIEDNEEDE